MTLEATMIENSPEMRKMYLAMAAKQESALVFKYKYDINHYYRRYFSAILISVFLKYEYLKKN